MKLSRKHYIVMMLVFLLSIAIITSFQPRFNQLILIIKHVSYFLFFSLLAVSIIILIYHRALKQEFFMKHTHQIYLKIFTLLIFGLMLYGLSNIQLNYIERYETPDLSSCQYYDEYGNLLYDSYFRFSCPVLEVIDSGDDYIVLNGIEQVTGVNDTFYLDGTRVNGGLIESQIDFDITVRYDELNRIKNYQLLWTQYSTIDTNNDQFYGYVSIKREISNDYAENEFTSTQNNYRYEKLLNGIVDSIYSDHYDFAGVTPIQNKYIVEFIEGTYNNFVSITNEYIDKDGNTGVQFIGDGFISNNRVGASISTDSLYTNEIFIDTSVIDHQARYIISQPTYLSLVYTNDYQLTKGLLLLVNREVKSTYQDKTYPYDIYEDSLNKEIYIEGLTTLSVLVNTDYGYQLENYMTGLSSAYPIQDQYLEALIVSPGKTYDLFSYLDYIDVLFNPTNSDERIIYPYNPIVYYMTYENDN